MIEKFNNYLISDEILKAIDALNYKEPTKVQKQVIPTVLAKKDVIVKSQTGSGKTASYAIPICESVVWEENKPQALVIVPTRELAIQVKEDFFNIGRYKRLKVASIFGRVPIQNQELEIKQKTHVVVGTPGRLMDLIMRGSLVTSKIEFLVIDEADELLSMGFIEQIESIIHSLPKERLTMLFSATLPNDIENLCNKYMNQPEYIQIEEESVTLQRIEQEKYLVDEEEKLSLLMSVTMKINPDSCIIFCNTKQAVDEVEKKLSKMGYSANKIHGGMEQKDRIKVMEQYRLGRFRYLIATDVASRGIDIDDVSLVINYEVPRLKENYVHRIGRTARFDKEGKAISLVNKREEGQIKRIEEYIKQEIAIVEEVTKEEATVLEKEFYLKNSKLPNLKEKKGANLNNGIMKLYINAGKKAKMRPVDLVGTICSIDGITPDDIGVIQIADILSYVEIRNNKGSIVLRELQNRSIKGKKRKVNKAKGL